MFLPLGGLGEVGMNCFVLQQDDEILVVDCGATFPDDDVGVDLVVPDFEWLLARESQVVGIFITHGHEDHIGALPHLLRRFKHAPAVFAPPHASALLATRFQEQKISTDCLHLVHPGEQYEIGGFSVEPIAVAHSIVDATALLIETKAGKTLHTADFDLDAEQPAGHKTDEARLREIGASGVALLLSDSTNIDVAERPFSEGDVYRELVRQIEGAEKRVAVGMFSSNLHRLQAMFSAAEMSGRKLCFLGRSLTRQVSICSDLGYLRYKSNLLVPPEALADLPPEQTLVVAGGSQGEPLSSLKRLSQGLHTALSLEPGDRVLLSSRVIPGNEKAVYQMVLDFLRKDIEVISAREVPSIHTSGHASRGELRTMLSWIAPRAFIPVHGTLHHLRRHAELARGEGVAQVQVVENGASVLLSKGGELRLGPAWEQGSVRLAFGGEILSSRQRRRRTELARRGSLLVSVAINEQGRRLGRLEITSMGIPGVDEDEGALQVIRSTAQEVVTRSGSRPIATLEDALGRALRRVIQEMCGARPVVSVHVLVVES
jgi:ribonuclease J